MRTIRHLEPRIRGRAGFTVVELLVSIAIIVLLIGILGASYAAVFGQSKRTATRSFMRNLTIALEQFKNDFDYYPPTLSDIPTATTIPGAAPPMTVLRAQPDPVAALQASRFNSIVTLPAYLIGVGRLDPDLSAQATQDPDRHDGVGGPGLRDPGPDRSWGGAVDRMNTNPRKTGRVYGPYMDLSQGASLVEFNQRAASLVNDEYLNNEFFVENGDFDGVFTFVDSWGTPIRYYQDWPTRNVETGRQSLSRVPIELINVESIIDFDTTDADDTLDPEENASLFRAPYALLSAGPDEVFADADIVTREGDEFNLGFAGLAIGADFSNEEEIMTISTISGTSAKTSPRILLTQTIRDNILVLP